MSDRPSPDIPPKKCLGCGYILDNLPTSRCPECGRKFSPDHPLTFSGGDPGRRPVHSGTYILIMAWVGVLLTFGALVYFAFGGGGAMTPVGDAVALCTALAGTGLEIAVLTAFLNLRTRGRTARPIYVAAWIALLSLCVVFLIVFSNLTNSPIIGIGL